MSDLQIELSSSIDNELVKELLEHYTEAKKRFRLGDLTPAAEAAGRFVESTLKCLLNLYDGRVVTSMGISFENTFLEIINTISPPDTITEYKLRLIPQVAKTVYTIRNKKQVAHARGEKLLFIDLINIIQSCDWIVASLLYVSHNVDEDEAIRMMIDIMELDTPLVQEIGEFMVLTTTRLQAKDALLLLLYRFGGSQLRSEIAKNMMLQFSKAVTYKAINTAHEDRMVFLDPKTNLISLLPKGRSEAERLAVELK